MKKIGLLGGTFDPPHFGHLMIANEVLTQCTLDEIWFIPAKEPPHKRGVQVTSLQHRIEMLQLAIESHPQFRICLIEAERDGPSYTYDTIQLLKKTYRDITFFFIIGADMVQDLPNWKHIDRLMEMITFIGVSRPGFSLKNNDIETVKLIEVPLFGVSSTFIRRRIKLNETVRYYLPEKVRDYIREKRLYE